MASIAAGRATASWRAVAVGLLVGGAGLVTAVGASQVSPWAAAVAAAVFAVGALLIGRHGRGVRFGWANAVTLTRLVGTCWIVALTAEAALAGLGVGERIALIALATTCLVLDGVDGRVARSRGETSAFGARFDMETDALQMLAVGVAIPLLGIAGWWTLAIPGLRYGYLAASWVLPVLRIPLAYGIGVRKVIAVVGQTSLIAAVLIDLVLPGWPASAVLAVGLAALVWSFGRDIGWQLARRRDYAAADPGRLRGPAGRTS